jgi:hypothetical protein
MSNLSKVEPSQQELTAALAQLLSNLDRTGDANAYVWTASTGVSLTTWNQAVEALFNAGWKMN